MTRRRMAFSAGVTAAALLLTFILAPLLAPLEEQMTRLRYAVRGDLPPDTNLVIVYIDNETIRSLGWPLQRNFYALLVNALQDLGVTTIAVDVMFEEERREYPEYDELFAHVAGAAKNVILPCYYRGVSTEDQYPADSVQHSPAYSGVHHVAVSGTGLHLPFPRLREAAAAIGHVNLSGAAEIPLFIRGNGGARAAFGLEIVRRHLQADRNAVTYDGSRLVVEGPRGRAEWKTSADGNILLNFPGQFTRFTSYPLLEVLKSYDAWKAGYPPAVPLRALRGKIALVGVVAEGRSEFRSTPLDPRYPALGLHAAFVDNALGGRFLNAAHRGVSSALALALGFICALAILSLSPPRAWAAVAGAIVLALVIPFALFAASAFLLPVTPLLFVIAAATAAATYRKARLVRREVRRLHREKESILAQLRDREAKVAVLEREMVTLESRASADRAAALMEEIRRYKAEIRTLSSQAEDMEAFQPEEAGGGEAEFEGIIYDGAGPMQQVVEFIGKIAGSDAPVLVLGETGTGKELVAKALHTKSPRTQRPFVAVNCGALSEQLLESELFGHERGAFTGAVREREGRFERADGGTIFLDEIGEVSENFQVKLLRVLQDGEFERVGGTGTRRVSVRVIAATNRDLRTMVESKKFRQDLFYRLNVLTVTLPPLRERGEDLPLLVGHFLKQEAPDIRISRNVMEALRTYAWPGNIRELESAIKRAVLLARSEKRPMVTVKDLPDEVAAAARGAIALDDQVLEAVREKSFSRSAITMTAEELGGLNRGTVAEYLRGQCLKAFVENGFDADRTIQALSLSPDPEINERVRKKLAEYLANVSEAVDPSRPWEENTAILKPKSKNLPQRYHQYLEQVAEAYYRGLWKNPS